MDWHVGNGHGSAGFELHVARFLEHRFKHWKPDSGDRSAPRRLLSALREKALIPVALPVQRSEHEEIVDVFGQYLSTERGLAAATVGSHKLLSLRFLREVLPAQTGLQRSPISYVERHALCRNLYRRVVS